MSKIFISHSSADNVAAQGLADWLAENGWHDVFLDIDPERGILAAQRWEQALHQAAQRCEAVVFLISRAWLGSQWCGNEWGLARQLSKPLFGLIIDRDVSIDGLRRERPDLAATFQLARLTEGEDGEIRRVMLPGGAEQGHVTWSRSGLQRLKRGLEAAGLDPKFFAWPPEGEPDRSPYPGLRALEAKDAGVFFGRDAALVEAGDRLRSLWQGAAPRVLMLMGASGAGKSSFLRAGLLPRLARDDGHFLVLAPMRPGAAALYGDNGLIGSLRAALPQVAGPDLREALERGAAGLRQLLHRLVEAKRRAMLTAGDTRPPPAIVLAVDQAEELAASGLSTEAAHEVHEFVVLLQELTGQDDPALILILTLRADAYDGVQRVLGDVRGTSFLLPPMPAGQLKEVIEGPARRRGEGGQALEIEPALTERLLGEAAASGGGDTLPLIALLLESLYRDHGASGVLRLGDYERSGGIGGAIDAAMRRVFTRARERRDLPQDEEALKTLLRRALIPWLAGIDPVTRQPRRASALASDIPPEARPLVDLMVEERLLVRTGGEIHGGMPVPVQLEPAHEALLRQWGMLKGWLDEDLGRLASLQGLRDAARDWDANAGAASWLAHLGARLEEAQALQARPDLFGQLNARDRSYLAACTAREDAERAEKAQARATEVALLKAEAEREREAASAAHDRLRASRRLLMASILALALVGAAGVYAWHLRNVATRQSQLAEAAKANAVLQKKLALAAKADAVVQKDAAVQANARAQAALTKATTTANGIVFGLVQKFKDKKDMQVAFLHQLIDPVLKMLDQLTATGDASRAMLQAKSGALTVTSRLLIRQGDLMGALRDSQRAEVIDKGLVASNANDTVALANLGIDDQDLGYIAAKQGDLAKAALDYGQYLAINQKLAARDPSNTGFQDGLAIAHEKVGDIAAKQDDLVKAAQDYGRMLKTYQKLAALDPSNTRFQDGLAIAHEKVGDIAAKQGDLVKAVQDYGQELAILQKLAARDPSNTGFQDGLAIAYEKVGDIAVRQGDLVNAAQDYGQYLAILQKLAARDPSNTRFQNNLAVAYEKVGDIAVKQGDLAKAAQDYRQALAILQKLAARDPSNTGFQNNLAIAHEKVGDIAQKQHDMPRAVANYHQVLIIARKLIVLNAHVPDWWQLIAYADQEVGKMERQQGQLDDARRDYAEMIVADRHLAALVPADAKYLEGDANSLGNLAWNYLLANNPHAAVVVARGAIGLAPQKLWIKGNLADGLMLTGHVNQARAIYLGHRGEKAKPNGKLWEQVVQSDFSALRKAGYKSALMDEITKAFATPQSH